MKISAIIVTKDRPKKLDRCIKSLKSKVDEIIVVDNASKIDTVDVLNKYIGIKVAWNQKTKGVSASRNQGARISESDYLLFIDDDAYLKSNTSINQIAEFLCSNKDVAVCVPKITYPNGTIQESVRNFPNLIGVMMRGTGIYKIFPNNRYYRKYTYVKRGSKPQSVDWGIGACMMVGKSFFEDIGGFDEKFIFGWEDIDFCKRVRLKNKQVVYIPSQTIIHDYERSSSKGILNRAKIMHLKSIVYYYKKHCHDNN